MSAARRAIGRQGATTQAKPGKRDEVTAVEMRGNACIVCPGEKQSGCAAGHIRRQGHGVKEDFCLGLKYNSVSLE